MKLDNNKNLNYTKFKDPFNYIVIHDFLDLGYLKKLDIILIKFQKHFM